MTQDQRVGEADVVVIGGGTGGYSTALRAAGLGLSVVLAERDKVGGTCLHRGCIPSKAMLHAAELVDGIAEARERWGVKAVLESVDWPALVATRDDIVARNHRGVQAHLAHARVEVVAGGAELTGPRTVRIEGYGEVAARRGIVLATGSRPRMLPGLAADGRGYVAPADWSRLETPVPGIHVVGDLLPPPSLGLAHASFAEGLLVAEALAGRRTTAVDYDAVPRVTYSAPQTAAVGLSEAAARDAGHDVVVNTLPLTAVAKGMVHGQGGMVKVVAERDGRVLGVHLVGPHVSEMIAESQLIVGWDAEPFDVAQHIHPHPTLSEAVGESFLTLAGRGLHQQA
ncbi:hypothetical protein AMK18_01980 [Streptomyces sp. CB01249]|uniref:FAD-dependent oxidoreductase n=1 Tax=Streptomyces sp. CB01249 TaxID=1703929 RepID=UPI00093CE471|nr:FAD-dependent oxidoreductase [Streptomyces sp. CB01249]OKJ03974.1 hypothetical protein AMK18_01980 [Streptomyces sp. CB01249]